MNKSLAVLILAVMLFKGVDNVSLTDEDYEMTDKLFTLGAEAFLKYLDNLKGAAEEVVEKNKIKKTGTDLQDLWISVKEMIKKISAEEEAKGRDHFLVALKIFHRLGTLYQDGKFRLLRTFPSNSWIDREFGMFKGIFKKEKVVELWKYVESNYLPGAPPIYSDPLGLLVYLLSKLGAQPQVAKILKVAMEVGETDINQLFEEVEMAVQLVREKAVEISTFERQTEKDEFLITLRTASGVLAFYWDKLLECTESQPFHNKYLAAVRRWKEMSVLKDTEKYHVIYSPETGLKAWTWADERFSDLFDNAALEYDRWGNGIFGDERFNQSSWAIMKMVTVYPLPIYERLSENGLGMSEVNDFFIDTENTLTDLLGEDILFNLKAVIYEIWNIISNEIFHVSINKKNQITSNVEYEDPLRHLRCLDSHSDGTHSLQSIGEESIKIKETCFAIWDRVLSEMNRQIKNVGHKELASRWDEVKRIFIKELTDSGEITQEKLDEAQKSLNSVTQMFFDKYVKMIDGLEERISASTEIIGKVMLMAIFTTDSVLVNLASLISN